MSGHAVIVRRDTNRGWFARCTEFGCAWRSGDVVNQSVAQKLADAHERATT